MPALTLPSNVARRIRRIRTIPLVPDNFANLANAAKRSAPQGVGFIAPPFRTGGTSLGEPIFPLSIQERWEHKVIDEPYTGKNEEENRLSPGTPVFGLFGGGREKRGNLGNPTEAPTDGPFPSEEPWLVTPNGFAPGITSGAGASLGTVKVWDSPR
jgi:hypothetical protein